MSTSGGLGGGISTIVAGAGITTTDPTGPDVTVAAMSADTLVTQLAADVALTAATQTVVLTTGSLSAGTWAIAWGVTVENGGATAGTLQAVVAANVGAFGTFSGIVSGETELPAVTGGSATLSGYLIVAALDLATASLYVTSSVAATAKSKTPTSSINYATGLVAQRVS